jgi:outer membrane protein OmpA-like peptidoglycan-associated protein
LRHTIIRVYLHQYTILLTKTNGFTMKRFSTLIVTLLFTTALMAQEAVKKEAPANFLVHITAFGEKRPLTYFTNLDNIHTKMDNKGLWHYYLGAFTTLEEAESVKKKLLEKGYPYAYVLDIEKTRRECKAQCDSEPTLDLPAVSKSVRGLSNILFDFGAAGLNRSGKNQLDNLVAVMSENGGYKVELKGHCDAIGSPVFNQALSEKRSNAARSYVNTKGIDISRIKTSSYGMDTPIAKNYKNGKDCPEGRKFNRRVEMFIMDAEGNVLNGLIAPFEIPEDLIFDGSKPAITPSSTVSPKMLGLN